MLSCNRSWCSSKHQLLNPTSDKILTPSSSRLAAISLISISKDQMSNSNNSCRARKLSIRAQTPRLRFSHMVVKRLRWVSSAMPTIWTTNQESFLLRRSRWWTSTIAMATIITLISTLLLQKAKCKTCRQTITNNICSTSSLRDRHPPWTTLTTSSRLLKTQTTAKRSNHTVWSRMQLRTSWEIVKRTTICRATLEEWEDHHRVVLLKTDSNKCLKLNFCHNFNSRAPKRQTCKDRQ